VRGGELKHVFKRALADLLPPEILNRKKRGFGTPMGAWLKRDLAPVLAGCLSADAVRARGLFRPNRSAADRRSRAQPRGRHRPHPRAHESRDLEPHLPRRPHAR
jgi:hypothetical protein